MKLALTLPGTGNTIPQPSGLNPDFKDLASFITPLINIVFYVAVFMAFIWLVWGAFSYIMAQGQKENLAKARARITWAIIGLMVVLLAYFIATFASEILPSRPSPGALPTPGGGLFR